MDILELRERIKAQIRKREFGSSSNESPVEAKSRLLKKLSETSFGYRVVEELKGYAHVDGDSLPLPLRGVPGSIKKLSLERKFKESAVKKNNGQPCSEICEKSKIQHIKDSRDYTFLFFHDKTVQDSVSQGETKPLDTDPATGITKKPPAPAKNNPGPSLCKEKAGIETKPPDKNPATGIIHISPAPAKNQARPSLSKEKTGIHKKLDNNVSAKPAENPKSPLDGKPWIKNAPPRQSSCRADNMKDGQRKRKMSTMEHDEGDEAERALGLIRKMFRYDPSKYNDRFDDDYNMEATFEDIQKEERRSAKIARKEDAEELRKLVVEEKATHAKKKHKLMN